MEDNGHRDPSQSVDQRQCGNNPYSWERELSEARHTFMICRSAFVDSIVTFRKGHVVAVVVSAVT